jgi:hypothetical protein
MPARGSQYDMQSAGGWEEPRGLWKSLKEDHKVKKMTQGQAKRLADGNDAVACMSDAIHAEYDTIKTLASEANHQDDQARCQVAVQRRDLVTSPNMVRRMWLLLVGENQHGEKTTDIS